MAQITTMLRYEGLSRAKTYEMYRVHDSFLQRFKMRLAVKKARELKNPSSVAAVSEEEQRDKHLVHTALIEDMFFDETKVEAEQVLYAVAQLQKD